MFYINQFKSINIRIWKSFSIYRKYTWYLQPTLYNYLLGINNYCFQSYNTFMTLVKIELFFTSLLLINTRIWSHLMVSDDIAEDVIVLTSKNYFCRTILCRWTPDIVYHQTSAGDFTDHYDICTSMTRKVQCITLQCRRKTHCIWPKQAYYLSKSILTYKHLRMVNSHKNDICNICTYMVKTSI